MNETSDETIKAIIQRLIVQPKLDQEVKSKFMKKKAAAPKSVCDEMAKSLK